MERERERESAFDVSLQERVRHGKGVVVCLDLYQDRLRLGGGGWRMQKFRVGFGKTRVAQKHRFGLAASKIEIEIRLVLGEPGDFGILGLRIETGIGICCQC
jgi:hypothetical protein